MVEAKKIFIIMSNTTGRPREPYTSEAAAKKNKKLLEHVRETFLIDE